MTQILLEMYIDFSLQLYIQFNIAVLAGKLFVQDVKRKLAVYKIGLLEGGSHTIGCFSARRQKKLSWLSCM